MKRIGLALVVVAGMAALPLAPVTAQNVVTGAQPAPPTLYVYNAGGRPTSKLGTWGNGQAMGGREYTYNGAQVLKIRSRNYYEGARFDLDQPIDLAPYKKDGFLRLRLRFREAPRRMEGVRGERGGAPRAPGAAAEQPGEAGGELPAEFAPTVDEGAPEEAAPEEPAVEVASAAGMPGRVSTRRSAQFGPMQPPRAPRPGGAGMPGFGGAPGDAPGGEPVGPPPQSTSITRMRISFMHERGVTVGSVPIDLNSMQVDENGWRILFFPLRDMRSSADVSGSVRRIVLTTDKDDTFWLAQFALVIETGQIRVAIRRPTDPVDVPVADITVKPGPLTLLADVESGVADPIIEWNFDADNVGNLPPAALSDPPAAVEGAPDGEPAAAPAAGPRIDARGLQARFAYPNEEQNYRVEVTVRDRSGQKTPVKSSILVRVRG